MNNPLSHLQPAALWRNFYTLTQIPRPSGHTEQIRRFLVDFGTNLGLETHTDQAGNILIRKPATAGMEAHKPVILQAHIDMVPQQNANIHHDFTREPLTVFIDGDWVRARDTTLGADNGIGMAAAMAVLESTDIAHPALEALFTNDEETGMYGVFGLKKGFLQGETLLNLDSEEEGALFVGCAGGIDADVSFRFVPVAVPLGNVALKLTLGGLLGGHSGLDIHLERANANKLMARLLKTVVTRHKARLAMLWGGSLRNAIPREAGAVIAVPADSVQAAIDCLQELHKLLQQEFEGIEKNISLDMELVETPDTVLPEELQEKLIHALVAAPDGVYRHIPQMPRVVETSSNLAVIATDAGVITIKYLLRSAVESKKKELCSILESVYSLAGAQVELRDGYPGWQPDFDSPVLVAMKTVYKELVGRQPKVEVIHAGLECGIIKQQYPNLDTISFGPNIVHPHSPDEKVNIASVGRFWNYLVAALGKI
ncbi:MAG: aminoacyl-histidine dipeptidase [Prevotellaceae bacterium]|jgi:dipeptidase D|nr:aminoacyl-histidine dipeptidase [Prevotellaceae bacterium]